MVLRWGVGLLLPLHSCNKRVRIVFNHKEGKKKKGLPFPFVGPQSAYTSNVEIEGSEHFELSSTGGDGGGAGG